jgi:hypothetical protein
MDEERERVVRMRKVIATGGLLRKDRQGASALTPSPQQMLAEISDIVKRMCFVCGKLMKARDDAQRERGSKSESV